MKYSFFVLVNNSQIFNNNIGRFFEENRDLISNIVFDDNINSKYKSIRDWLNEKLNYIYSNRAEFENCYIFFVHQDVYISSSFFVYFEQFANLINQDELGLIGFAGKDSRNKSYGFLLDSGLFCFIGGYSPVEVETVDELCFAIPSNILFKRHLFLSDIDGWHAYAAEFSILLKIQGFKTYYFPIFLEHNSVRTNNAGLFKTHKKIFQIYKTNSFTLVGEIRKFSWLGCFNRNVQEFYYSKIRFSIKSRSLLRLLFYVIDFLRPSSFGLRRLDFLLSMNDCDFFYFDDSPIKIEDFSINKIPVKILFMHRYLTDYQKILGDYKINKNIFVLGCKTKFDGFKYIKKLDVNYKIL